ncbi:MAG: hypothetical protein E5V30_19985 [Mesorhizobium sp.]|nr:MAG: hypothetical protein E5V30_19985 [Mesorhizobium sp.]
MKKAIVVISTITLLGFFGSAQAQQVTASGCAEAGTEAKCIMLKDGDKLYNITSAKPTPTVGTYGTVTGTVSSGADLCQQGTLLEAAEWKPDPEKACANKQ